MAEWYSFSELVKLLIESHDTKSGILKPMDHDQTIDALRDPAYVQAVEAQLRAQGHTSFRFAGNGNKAIAIESEAGKVMRLEALDSPAFRDRPENKFYLQADATLRTDRHQIEIMDRATSLKQLVEQGRLTVEQATRHFEKLEKGLAQAGIIISDLRQGNLMRFDNVGLTKDGLPLVIDPGTHPLDGDQLIARMREGGMEDTDLERRYLKYRSEPPPDVHWPEIEPRRVTPAADVAHGQRYPFPGPDPHFGSMDIKPVEAAVARVRQAAAAGKPVSAADSRMIVEWSVHNFRSIMNERVARAGESIFSSSLRGACGNVPDLVSHALRQLGVPVNSANMGDVAHLDRPTHQVATVSFPVTEGGKTRTVTYLIDPTFRQFFHHDSIDPHIRQVGERLSATPEGARIANQILRHGYIELTPEVAAHYARAFNPNLTPDQLKNIAASYTNPDLDHPPSKSQIDYLKRNGEVVDPPGHVPAARPAVETERPRGLRMPDAADAPHQPGMGRLMRRGGLTDATLQGATGNYLGSAIGVISEFPQHVGRFFTSVGQGISQIAAPVAGWLESAAANGNVLATSLVNMGTTIGGWAGSALNIAGRALPYLGPVTAPFLAWGEGSDAVQRFDKGDVAGGVKHVVHGTGYTVGGTLMAAGLASAWTGVGAVLLPIGGAVMLGTAIDQGIDKLTGGYSIGGAIGWMFGGSSVKKTAETDIKPVGNVDVAAITPVRETDPKLAAGVQPVRLDRVAAVDVKDAAKELKGAGVTDADKAVTTLAYVPKTEGQQVQTARA